MDFQIFSPYNLLQSPLNIIIFHFSQLQQLLEAFNKNKKQRSCEKVLNLALNTIFHIWFGSNTDIRKLSTLVSGGLLIHLL